MLIYRVEHKDSGLGPYMHIDRTTMKPTDRIDLNNILITYLFDTNHPEPKFEDGKRFNLNMGCLYGFLDQSQLMDWFYWIPYWAMNRLNELGFMVKVYEQAVDRVYILAKQVAFLPKGSTVDHEMSFIQFCDNAEEFA